MATASSFSAYSVVPRRYPSDRHFTLPSSSFASLQQINVTVVTGQSWKTSVLESKTPVLVEFYASWCGPCQMVHRVIDEVATEYAGRLKCYVLNADQDPLVAQEYDVKAVPIVLLFKNGDKCETVIGTMPKDFYVAAIERVLCKA